MSPKPYIVTHTKGSMVTAQRRGPTLTCNTSFFKRVTLVAEPPLREVEDYPMPLPPNPRPPNIPSPPPPPDPARVLKDMLTPPSPTRPLPRGHPPASPSHSLSPAKQAPILPPTMPPTLPVPELRDPPAPVSPTRPPLRRAELTRPIRARARPKWLEDYVPKGHHIL